MNILDMFKGKDGKKNNIIQDGFDEMIWNEMRNKSPKIRQEIDKGQEVLHSFLSLSQDIFASLYKGTPVLTDTVPYGTELNRKQVETFLESQECEDLRMYTQLDDYASAVSCTTVLDEITTRLKEDENLRKLAEEQNKENKEEEEETKDDSPEQQEKKQQQRDKMQSMINNSAGNIRRAVNAGIKKAKQEAEENAEAINSLGWDNSKSELTHMPFKDRDVLMQQLKRVKDLSKYIGRMRALATATSSTKIRSNQVELCGVTMGNDIARALPQELVQLRHPLLRYNIYSKLAEHQLLQYEMKRNEKMGRGHIICLVDDSGSMYGEASKLARGAMFGLLECAKLDKRNFAVDIFSDTNSEYKKEFKGGKATIQETLDILGVNFGGGTDYDGPIKWAMKKIEEAEYKNADIVIITDGQCRLADHIRKELVEIKKKTGTKIVGIMLCGTPQELSQWCDNIYTDLGDDTMSDIMNNI